MNIERLSIHNTNKFKYTDTRNDKKNDSVCSHSIRRRQKKWNWITSKKMKITKNIWIWTLMRLFVMHLRCTNWKRNLYVDWFKFHGKHIKHFSVECVECVFAKWQKKNADKNIHQNQTKSTIRYFDTLKHFIHMWMRQSFVRVRQFILIMFYVCSVCYWNTVYFVSFTYVNWQNVSPPLPHRSNEDISTISLHLFGFFFLF